MLIRNICCIFLSLVVSLSVFADSLFIKYDSTKVGQADAKVYIGNRGPYHLCAKSANGDCKGKKNYLDINPYNDKEITLPEHHLTLKTSLGLHSSGGCNYVVTIGKDSSVIRVDNHNHPECSYNYCVASPAA